MPRLLGRRPAVRRKPLNPHPKVFDVFECGGRRFFKKEPIAEVDHWIQRTEVCRLLQPNELRTRKKWTFYVRKTVDQSRTKPASHQEAWPKQHSNCFEQMKNLSENHTEVISGFLFACFSLIVASTAHKALIPMPKFAQEYLNFMSLKKKVWNGDMGMDRILLRGMVWGRGFWRRASMKSQPLALYENMFFFTQSLYKMKVYDHILQPQDCPDILLKM